MSQQVIDNLDFKVTFDLRAGVKKFIFEDTTPYSGLGINLSSCLGYIKITGPDGNVYWGSDALLYPDIDLSVSPINNTIDIPLDLDGEIIKGPGEWLFRYTLEIDDTDSNEGIYAETKNYKYNYVPVEVDIEVVVDIPNGRFSSQDVTSYGPNVVSLNRLHQIEFLDGPEFTTIIDTIPFITVTYPYIYTGHYLTTINSNFTLDYGGGIFFTDFAEGTKEFTVYDYKLCEYYCCTKKLRDRYRDVGCVGIHKEQLQQDFVLANALVNQIEQAYRCSKLEDVDDYIAELRELVGHHDDEDECECANGAPVQVIPVLFVSIGGGGGGGGIPSPDGQDGKFLMAYLGSTTWQSIVQGEINTASNSTSGSGSGLLYKGKFLMDLVFRKLKEAVGIKIVTHPDDIDISVDPSQVQMRSERGQPSGYAPLGPDGKVPSANIPNISIGEAFIVNNQAEMLALDAQIGDVAVRKDVNDAKFMLLIMPPTVAANWSPINAAGEVLSVNGQTGHVAITLESLGGTINYDSVTNKPSINGVELIGDKSTADLGINYVDIPGIPIIPDELADLQDDITHRTVTDNEKAYWDAKADTSYVDQAVEGLKWKDQVRAATVGNIILFGIQTVDTVPLTTGDRVLVKNQTDGTQNGLYVADAGVWSRTSDANTGPELSGASVNVREGSIENMSRDFVCTNNTIILGTTIITFINKGGNVPDGDETNAGKFEEATDAEMAGFIGTGGSGARLVVNPQKFGTWWNNGGRILNTLLTGLNNTLSGVPLATDSILIAFGKVANFLGSLFYGNLVFAATITYDLTGKRTDSRKLPGISGNFALNFVAGQSEDGCVFHVYCVKSTAAVVTVTLGGAGITHKDAEVTMTALGLPSGAIGDVWHLIGKLRWTGTAIEVDWVTRDGEIVQVLSASTSDYPSVGLVNSLFAVSNADLLTRFKQDGNSFGVAGKLGTLDAFDMIFIRNNVVRMTLTIAGVRIIGTGAGKIIEVQNASTVERLQVLDSGNVGWSGGSYGGGVIVEFNANATTVPTTNPVAGYLRYGQGGVPKFRTEGGVIQIPVLETFPANTVFSNPVGSPAPAVPTPGINIYDADQAAYTYNLDGLNETLISVIKESVLVASVVVVNTAARTAIYTYTIPAYILKVRKEFSVELEGLAAGLGGATIVFDVELAGAIIATSAAVGGSPNRVLRLNFTLACRTVGTAGTVIGQGQAGEKDFSMAAPVTANTTVDLVLKLSATWSAADAGNSLTITNGRVKRYN